MTLLAGVWREWVGTTFREQIHEVIDLLQTAEKQAKQVKQRMRKQHLSFGPALDHFDDDFPQLVNRLRYMERVAQHQEASAAQRAKRDSSSDEA
jgi:hypothetical protein